MRQLACIKFTHGLHDAALPVLAAIDARSPEALSDSSAKLDAACENCHKWYWYPNQEETLRKLRQKLTP